MALGPMELRLPRVRPLKTKFNAFFFRFCTFLLQKSCFLKKLGGEKVSYLL